jgi:hypothetical protein
MDGARALKVLIIPEDQTYDGYILKPIVEAMISDLGWRAAVDVLPEPRLRGASDALDKHLIASITEANPMIDLFLLIVDRDCDRFGNVTKASERQKEQEGRLLACVAREEVEVWMLALHTKRLPIGFREVLADCDPKEKWADPLLDELGRTGPGGGRKHAYARSVRCLSKSSRSMQRARGAAASPGLVARGQGVTIPPPSAFRRLVANSSSPSGTPVSSA